MAEGSLNYSGNISIAGCWLANSEWILLELYCINVHSTTIKVSSRPWYGIAPRRFHISDTGKYEHKSAIVVNQRLKALLPRTWRIWSSDFLFAIWLWIAWYVVSRQHLLVSLALRGLYRSQTKVNGHDNQAFNPTFVSINLYKDFIIGRRRCNTKIVFKHLAQYLITAILKVVLP